MAKPTKSSGGGPTFQFMASSAMPSPRWTRSVNGAFALLPLTWNSPAIRLSSATVVDRVGHGSWRRATRSRRRPPRATGRLTATLSSSEHTRAKTDTGGGDARWHGGGVPESQEEAERPRGLPQRAPPRRARRAPRLPVHLGRRASLHRLHHVSRRAAVSHLPGGADADGAARLDGRRAALARSDARGRGSVDARQHLGRP